MVQMLCPVIVDRDGERANLATMLPATAHDGGGMVALLGERGVGKTRLVRELIERAQAAGMPALLGRAAKGGSTAPFRPLVEALLAELRTRQLPELTDLEPFRPALGRLLPPLRTERPSPADESMTVLSEGVLRLLRALAGRSGLLLVLEDMHRADVETLTVLEYLADHLAGEPVLTVITLRPETVNQEIDLAQQLQARGAAATAIELDRLDEAGVAGMVRACLDNQVVPDGVLGWLSDLAEGLPLFVEELLAAAITSDALRPGPGGWSFIRPESPLVPAGFADAVRRRLATMNDTDGATGWVVHCAAVLGRVFDARLLPALAGQGRAAVAASLHRAGELQLVAPHEGDRGTHRFRYALTREALLGELPVYQRRELAGAALEIVTQAHPELPGEWCELAARLAEQAGEAPRATSGSTPASRWSARTATAPATSTWPSASPR